MSWKLGRVSKGLRNGHQKPLGILARLIVDTRANTLAMMAAALIPVAGLTGSAIDAARMYVVKVRLQQACDAGALAGRKFMVVDSNTTLDANATQQAQNFFNNNFPATFYDASSVSFTPTRTTDNQVAGTARATVPMAVMGMFGFQPVTMQVTCQARFDVADVDVMFVLDTTGSMACAAATTVTNCNNYAANTGNQTVSGNNRYVNEVSGSRIDAVRTAVASFYDTLTSAADASTHLRFGFVPYSTTVNVGYIIPQTYLATSAPYQTRVLIGEANSGSPSVTTLGTNVASSACTTGTTRSPGAYPAFTSSGTAVESTVTWTKNTSGNTSLGTCKRSNQTVIPNWKYQQATLDTSQFITGAAVTLPTMVTGATDTWEGCIEEADPGVRPAPSTFSQSALPNDLNPDMTPSRSDSTTLWRPMWFDVEYDRNNATSETTSTSRSPGDRYYAGSWYPATSLAYPYNSLACPKQAQRLTTMSKADVQNYVSASTGFRPYGLTYHDIGMTWGARFLDPSGPFGADTAAWSGRNAPNRYIVFLTDGDMENQNFAYEAHGFEKFDNRTTSDGGANNTNLLAAHNTRFVTECTAAKSRGITIFVVAYAQTLTTQLTQCASPGRAYYASDDASLTSAFRTIAQQIAMLRLTQ